MQVYEVINTNPLIQTVLDYLQDADSPATEYSDNPDSFLKVQNNSGITNRQAIESRYTSSTEIALQGKNLPASQLPLKLGTILAIEKQKASIAGLLTQGLEVVNYNVPAFKAKALAQLESDIAKYSIVDVLKPINGQLTKGIAKESFPDISVWIWCKSLASSSNNYDGEIFNVTPFVEAIDTNMGMNGGNFDLRLPPLICEQNSETGQWAIKKKSIQYYKGKKNLSLQNQGYLSDNNLYSVDAQNNLVRNSFLFHTILNTNDLIYIRFETLKLEADQRIADEASLSISKSQLPGRIYDMIGLIDSNGIKIIPSPADVTIQISGRDLSKIFIEDGAYCFFLEMSQGMLGGPESANSKVGDFMNRLSTDSGLQFLNLFYNSTIDKVFEFVINQLSNISIVPNDLFINYGDRRNTRFELKQDPSKSNLNNQISDLQGEVFNQIENVRATNGLSENISSVENTKVQEIYNQMHSFLQAIRDNKVRQVSESLTIGWGAFFYSANGSGILPESIDVNTFPFYFTGNLFNLIQTQQVPQARSIVQLIDQIIDTEISQVDYNTGSGLQSNIAPGIWQIIKLVIDKSVLQRKIVDSSLSSANGSLISFFRKVCQSPLVEFYMDTYADTYNIIIRKPPTDRVSIRSLLMQQINVENIDAATHKKDSDTTTTASPVVIDINPEDVLEETLFFDDSEAYSWYHLYPKAIFQGTNNTFSLSYLPAVFLPQYGEIWGSKPFEVIHNYLPVTMRDVDQQSIDFITMQAIQDMRYIIESHAYLPFTRKGTIKMNGDRRMKIGNLIRYKPTGEIFRIDAVKQSWSIGEAAIERTTMIEVSRGMVEQLIYGIRFNSTNGDSIAVNYFDIVNTNFTPEYINETEYVTQKVKVSETNIVTPASQTLIPSSDQTTLSFQLTILGNQNAYLLDLYSTTKGRFIQLINAINKLGYRVSIQSTVRKFEKQYGLWQDDHRNARPGHSRHEEGLAIDMDLITPSGQFITRAGNTVQDWLATGVPQLAKSMGFKWGGDAFKNFHDTDHFEISSITQVASSVTQPVYEDKQIPVSTKELDTSKIFSNFKVNQAVFDFFMTRKQFDKQYQTVSSQTFYDNDGNNAIGTLDNVTVVAKKKK